MFAIDRTDIQRFAVSSVGALILSAACIVAAVGPATPAQAEASLTVPARDNASLPEALRACPRTIAMRL